MRKTECTHLVCAQLLEEAGECAPEDRGALVGVDVAFNRLGIDVGLPPGITSVRRPVVNAATETSRIIGAGWARRYVVLRTHRAPAVKSRKRIDNALIVQRVAKSLTTTLIKRNLHSIAG
jgi:hypothetical protein